ncbi:hypothetical protein KXV55_008351 [Aspergillus fumigatus]|nr:hypothetical protein KXV28_006640 [Aspergillus fumigatus]KAH3517840.1 hypothetical protein KXV55_008351 [Aspergillus fumigatus]
MLLMDRALKPNWLVPVLIVDIDGVIDRTVGTKAKDQETATRSPRAHPDACPLSQRRQCQAGFAQTFWASRFDFHPERRICFEATDPSYSSIAEQRTETREFLWKKQDYCLPSKAVDDLETLGGDFSAQPADRFPTVYNTERYMIRPSQSQHRSEPSKSLSGIPVNISGIRFILEGYQEVSLDYNVATNKKCST